MSLDAAIQLLDRKSLLGLIHDDIEGLLQAERIHAGVPEAGCQLYHKISDIIAAVEGVGLDWHDIRREKSWLVQRAIPHVLPFLDVFLDHATGLVRDGATNKDVMRRAFADRMRREIRLAGELGVPAVELEKRIARARMAGVWIKTRVAGR